MAYLSKSSHYRHWIFTKEDLLELENIVHCDTKRFFQAEVEKNGEISASTFASVLAERTLNRKPQWKSWNKSWKKEEIKQDAFKVDEFCLTMEEERTLVSFYAAKVQESCSSLFRTSDKVKCCAVMLYKRFYLSNSVMCFHPKYIVPTVIYVAGKVEEEFINVDTIAELLKVDHTYVIRHELIVLQGVHFETIMYHPFRALRGFMDDARGYFKAKGITVAIDTLQKIHGTSSLLLHQLCLSDIPLRFTPSMIALCVFRSIALQNALPIDEYVKFNLKNDTQMQRLQCLEEEIQLSIQQQKDAANDQSGTMKIMKGIYKKLKPFYPTSKSGKSSRKKQKV